MIPHQLIFLLLFTVLLSCSDGTSQQPRKVLDESKFVAYAEQSFAESQKTGTAEARNIRVDTILVISSRRAERIKAMAFERDYKFRCQIDSVPYSKEAEQDSVRRRLKRAERYPDNDTVGYRVKFKLDYVIDGRLEPNVWIKSFDTNYQSFDELDGPLLKEEYFLLDDLEE